MFFFLSNSLHFSLVLSKTTHFAQENLFMQNGHICMKEAFLPKHWVYLTPFFAPNHCSVAETQVFHQIV